jgi:hypothetical protein
MHEEKRNVPFLEYCFQSLAQEFALVGGLKTEIADQATAIPFGVFQYAAEEVQIPLQSLPGSNGLIVQSLFDHCLGVSKIAVQYFLGKRLFGAEVIGERALRNTSGRADIAHTRPLVSQSKHYLHAAFKNSFAM